MIDRRTILLKLAAAGGTALSYAVLSGCAKGDSTKPVADAPKPDDDAALRDDLARMGAPREDSEVGVPVFLACVDLVAERDGKPAVPANAFSAQIAADLRRYGDGWLKLHPDAKEGDVAHLIQVLAERDFNTVKGGAA
ncbi:MAG: hypothetical protein QM760_07175 [Nibricoccus sp.]